MASFRFTKLKIVAGYTLLLTILLFSLVFVHREMAALSEADNQQNLKTDSLLSLLREKDQNTIQMLRVLSEANDSLLSASEIGEIIFEQDPAANQHRVQRRVITKRDSLITAPKKKGFFKRLAEVFVPSKKDSALLINSSLEFATDTILEPAASADSLQHKIRQASKGKRTQRKKTVRRDNARFQQTNTQLTAQIDTLIKDYKSDMSQRAREDAEWQQEVRMRSIRTISGIAVGAVLLSALFLILIGRDITRSNRYRQQLEVANKKAEELLIAREKLMLAITHDFKAPLGSIIGYSELLRKLVADERQRFYLNNMKISSEHLLKLVSDLLDFHRLDLNKAEVKRVPFKPIQLFEEIRTSFEPLTATKGLSLECDIAPELAGTFISDPLRIRQIVNNLLSNAVKFTQQGSVTLTIRYEEPHLILSVADTGQGMAREDKERIFQEFTRLPGAQGEEGFGLGLSIVRKLVLLLKGEIQVESTLGEGSCFTVTLVLTPVQQSVSGEEAADELQNLETEEESIAVAPIKTVRVLLIDDDRIQLELTAAMLQQYGIDAICCEQLEDLSDHLRSSVFDVLLTDIQMPAINGFDLVKLLRASNIPQARTIPVIAVTARHDMDEQALREHGFAGCLHKPFSVRELLATISLGQMSADEVQAIDLMLAKDDFLSDEQETRLSARNLLFNFSALTAFSGDDTTAARSIINSFVEETAKNAISMKQALKNEEVDGIADMAHKLLPLFTLIKANDALPLLTYLEEQRGESFTEIIRQKTERVLVEVNFVVEEAKRYSVC